MKLKHVIATALMTFPAVQGLGVELCPSEQGENYTERLFGTWKADPVVLERMQQTDNEHISEISFSNNEEILPTLPGYGYCAYTGGVLSMTIQDSSRTFPFYVINYEGHPMVVFFEADADRESGWDAESLHIAVARSEVTEGDILFVGGDHLNEGFLPFMRK